MFKHLKSVSLDLGVVVQKPNGQEEEEPQACIGVCRFDKIDPKNCSKFPDRYAAEAASLGVSRDALRASHIVGMDVKELQRLAKEEVRA
jgi:hypothetical protein